MPWYLRLWNLLPFSVINLVVTIQIFWVGVGVMTSLFFSRPNKYLWSIKVHSARWWVTQVSPINAGHFWAAIHRSDADHVLSIVLNGFHSNLALLLSDFKHLLFFNLAVLRLFRKFFLVANILEKFVFGQGNEILLELNVLQDVHYLLVVLHLGILHLHVLLQGLVASLSCLNLGRLWLDPFALPPL